MNVKIIQVWKIIWALVLSCVSKTFSIPCLGSCGTSPNNASNISSSWDKLRLSRESSFWSTHKFVIFVVFFFCCCCYYLFVLLLSLILIHVLIFRTHLFTTQAWYIYFQNFSAKTFIFGMIWLSGNNFWFSMKKNNDFVWPYTELAL